MSPRKPKHPHDPLTPINTEQLRAAIESRGLSQREIATAVGVSPSQINDLARGKVGRCRESVLRTLAAVLRVPPARLETAQVRGRRRQGAPGGRLFSNREHARSLHELLASVGVKDPSEALLGSIILEPDAWRHVLLSPATNKGNRFELQDFYLTPAEADDSSRRAFATAIAAALKLVLEPAISAKRPLAPHAKAVGQVLRVLWERCASVGRVAVLVDGKRHARLQALEDRDDEESEDEIDRKIRSEIARCEIDRRAFASTIAALDDAMRASIDSVLDLPTVAPTRRRWPPPELQKAFEERDQSVREFAARVISLDDAELRSLS